MASHRIFLLAVASITSALYAETPAFEIASVKPSPVGDTRRPQFQFLPGGRFVAVNYPLLILVAQAWRLPFNRSPRLTGAPDWTGSERYDIDAKASGGALPPGLSAMAMDDRMRLMVQSLLIDRFKLDMRRSTKELPVFAIVIGKDGPKLEKSKTAEKDCSDTPSPEGPVCHQITGGQGRGLHAQAAGISDLAHYVENWAERPVIDNTGLKGLFRLETKGWAPIHPGPPPTPGAKAEDGSDMADLQTLFQVFEGMGLKLVPEKASVDVFHIEHIERPAGN